MFQARTYIVLDLPPEIAAEVSGLRLRYDQFESKLPAEITVAGSSGIGVLADHQDAEYVFEKIQCVASEYKPLITAFVSMERFPGVPIFWLKPRDRTPFDALQKALVDTGIQFLSTPYPFNPHCTISATVPLTEEQEVELLNSPFPKQEFVLEKLCVYQLLEGRASLLRAFSLSREP